MPPTTRPTTISRPMTIFTRHLPTSSLRINYIGTHAHRRSAQLGQHEHGPAGCSKRPSSKAARGNARGIPLGYVEGLNDARTLLAEFFSSLLVLVSIGEGSTTVNVSQ
jgi:hypothetical protein